MSGIEELLLSLPRTRSLKMNPVHRQSRKSSYQWKVDNTEQVMCPMNYPTW